MHSCTHSLMILRTLSLCQTTTRSVDSVINCAWNINDVVYHRIRSYDVRWLGNGNFCISFHNNIIALVIGRYLAAKKGLRPERVISHVTVGVYVLNSMSEQSNWYD